jgi:integrase
MAKGLTDRAVAGARPRAATYRLSDGGGLLLQVKPGGGRSWLVRLTQDGRRRDVGLGLYPEIGLAEARRLATEARRLAREGLDPAGERDLRQHRAAEAQSAEIAKLREAEQGSFASMVTATIAALEPSWRSKRTAPIWRQTFANWILPKLGPVPVRDIDRRAVAAAFADVWREAPGLADKLLQRAGTVLRFAQGRGLTCDPSAASLSALLADKLLPPLPGGRGHPMLPWATVPAFVAALDKEAGLGPLALRLVLLTAQRSGQIRLARWNMVSFEGPTPSMTFPPDVMKLRQRDRQEAHRVPLPPQALDTLRRAFTVATGVDATLAELPTIAARMGDALIFAGARGTPPSDMTLSAVIRRMNAGATPAPWRDDDGRPAVVHGLRATFSTWVDDVIPAERESAERQLAHVPGNRVSRAYRRGDSFGRRVELMAAWADHCCSALPAAVAAIAPTAARVRS